MWGVARKGNWGWAMEGPDARRSREHWRKCGQQSSSGLRFQGRKKKKAFIEAGRKHQGVSDQLLMT